MKPTIGPNIIQPSSIFYVQGSQGGVTALPSPPPVWSGSLVGSEDLLALDVAIWQKSATEGFIAFDVKRS
jgi:hypothetical protein